MHYNSRFWQPESVYYSNFWKRSVIMVFFYDQAHILLRNVNKYRGEQPMRMDIQSAVRIMMNKVNLDAFEGDSTVTFFVEWINSVLR